MRITSRSEPKGRKSISKSAVKAAYALLRRNGKIRRAETVRFIALTAHRTKDYKKLRPQHVKIDLALRAVKIEWHFAKNRVLYNKAPESWHPFGRTGSFYDILTCVQNLFELRPGSSSFLLRFSGLSHSKLLRDAFSDIEDHLQPLCVNKISPYFFKNLMSLCCMESNVAAEVVSHYLMHTLSKSEWQQLCRNSRINLSTCSAGYVIGEDLLPHIREKFQHWWD